MPLKADNNGWFTDGVRRSVHRIVASAYLRENEPKFGVFFSFIALHKLENGTKKLIWKIGSLKSTGIGFQPNLGSWFAAKPRYYFN